MELEQAAWAAFDLIRAEAPPCPAFDKLAEYHCNVCGGRKSYDVYDDLPVCTDCGKVDDSYVSDEPEWRSGLDESGVASDPSRIGAPVNTDHFSAAWGQGTLIRVPAWRGPNSPSTYKQMRMARIHQHSTMNHRDRALFHAYLSLDKVGKQILNLPEAVLYQAKIKYKAFNEAVLTRGAVRNGIKANCIFQACREFGVARTTKEIADAFGIPPRDLSRTTEIFQEQVPDKKVHVTTPADLIARFVNEIACIPDAVRGRIKMKIVKGCHALDECVELMGRTPKAVACAVIFYVLSLEGLKPNKTDICRICDVSVPTLGKIETLVKESGLL
jgi:transcription initiation factor TFIIIB Brf1 subunit/transcription initiation factor TFIIB